MRKKFDRAEELNKKLKGTPASDCISELRPFSRHRVVESKLVLFQQAPKETEAQQNRAEPFEYNDADFPPLSQSLNLK